MTHARTAVPATGRPGAGAVLRLAALVAPAVLAVVVLGGCSSFASLNGCQLDTVGTPRCPALPAVPALQPTRATLAVDGARGNPRVLMLVAFSGGGSRAAYLATETMIALRSFAGADLLAEVDVLTAVSGGALAAAFYAATRDATLALPPETAAALQDALLRPDAPRQLGLVQDGLRDHRRQQLRCSAALDHDAKLWLLQQPAQRLPWRAIERIDDLCRQAGLTKLRAWSDDDARERMSRNYIRRLIGNLAWPVNVLRYWFTAYDRSDIMAQTLSDSLFDQPLVGVDHRFADLNPTRPFLVIHATNATDLPSDNEYERLPAFPFGSSFTFTREDFQQRLHSDIGRYPLGQAVMASSAFPLAFPHVTLENFHALRKDRRCPTDERWLASCGDLRYLHLIDGGNADNLGLRSVKRILLELAAGGRLVEDYGSVVVVLVDAFTRPGGADRGNADPRSLFDRLVDFTSLSEAVDVLLQASRRHTLDQFTWPATLLDLERDCGADDPHLSAELCGRLRAADIEGARAHLAERLVFFHFGFEAIGAASGDRRLKAQLDRIPTSFAIDDGHVQLIRDAVGAVLNESHPCLQQLAHIVQQEQPGVADAATARQACASAVNGAAGSGKPLPDPARGR